MDDVRLKQGPGEQAERKEGALQVKWVNNSRYVGEISEVLYGHRCKSESF